MLEQPRKTVPKQKEQSTASKESPNMMEAMNTLMKQQMQMQKLMVQMIAKNREQEKKLAQTEKELRSKQDQLEYELRVRREQEKEIKEELEQERKIKSEEPQWEHNVHVGTLGNTEQRMERETIVSEQNKEGEMEGYKRVNVDHVADQLRCSKEEHDKIGLKRNSNEEITAIPIKISRLEDNEGLDGETVDDNETMERQTACEEVELNSLEMNKEQEDQEQFVEKVMEFWGQPVQLEPVDLESEQDKEVKQALEDLESDTDIVEVEQERKEPVLIDLESEENTGLSEQDETKPDLDKIGFGEQYEERQREQEERRQKLRSALLKKQQAIHEAHMEKEQQKVVDEKKIEEYQQLKRAEWKAKMGQDSLGEEIQQQAENTFVKLERLRPRTEVHSYSEELAGSDDNDSFDSEYSPNQHEYSPRPSHHEYTPRPQHEYSPRPSLHDSEHNSPSQSQPAHYESGYCPRDDRPYCPRGERLYCPRGYVMIL